MKTLEDKQEAKTSSKRRMDNRTQRNNTQITSELFNVYYSARAVDQSLSSVMSLRQSKQ